MKVYLYTLAIMVMAMLTTGCGGSVDPNKNIAMARSAISTGDYKAALSALDEAKSVMTDTTASATALTEVAALYCVIDEKMQAESNMDKALKCYELAIRINPDSAKYCFHRLSVDEQCLLDLVDKLHNARRSSTDFAEPYYDADTDSILHYDHIGDDEIIDDIDIME